MVFAFVIEVVIVGGSRSCGICGCCLFTLVILFVGLVCVFVVREVSGSR